MFLIRRAILSRQNLTLKLIQDQIVNSKNVDATSFTRGVKFCQQQRFCSSELKQQSIPEEKEIKKQPLGSTNITKMKLIFTCKKCSTRNNKIISKLGYEKGVVIVRCDGCSNNHLIADNLGWFADRNEKTNIEYILKKKGETVRRIPHDSVGYMEFVTKEILMEFQKQQEADESLSKNEQLVSDNNNNKCQEEKPTDQKDSDKKEELK